MPNSQYSIDIKKQHKQ